MKTKTTQTLSVGGCLTRQGLDIIVEQRKFPIVYPKKIWQSTPIWLKKFLLDNLTFAETHYLPLMLKKSGVDYSTNYPFFEPIFYKNQLLDMLICEKTDKVKPLSYLRRFYNLTFSFASSTSRWPEAKTGRPFSVDPKTVVIPFTFGKESLTTLALSLEIGLRPVLFYSQEPVQPYEESYKKRQLASLGRLIKVPVYFLQHEPGLFRYGRAWFKNSSTELGWGSQTSILTLLALPFVLAHRAGYIFFGSEFANNEFEFIEGFKAFLSADQTAAVMALQDNMARLFTNGQAQVKSSLQPLEEVNIFYILHHRYPKLGQMQFSCSAEKPLLKGSQWCHNCYKCARMFLFARACGLNPFNLGFKKDLLLKKGMFNHYFGSDVKSGSVIELDFAFYAAYKRQVPSIYHELFKKNKLPVLKPWPWYKRYFSKIHENYNLPLPYQARLFKIFNEELKSFAKNLPK